MLKDSSTTFVPRLAQQLHYYNAVNELTNLRPDLNENIHFDQIPKGM